MFRYAITAAELRGNKGTLIAVPREGEQRAFLVRLKEFRGIGKSAIRNFSAQLVDGRWVTGRLDTVQGYGELETVSNIMPPVPQVDPAERDYWN